MFFLKKREDSRSAPEPPERRQASAISNQPVPETYPFEEVTFMLFLNLAKLECNKTSKGCTGTKNTLPKILRFEDQN